MRLPDFSIRQPADEDFGREQSGFKFAGGIMFEFDDKYLWFQRRPGDFVCRHRGAALHLLYLGVWRRQPLLCGSGGLVVGLNRFPDHSVLPDMGPEDGNSSKGILPPAHVANWSGPTEVRKTSKRSRRETESAVRQVVDSTKNRLGRKLRRVFFYLPFIRLCEPVDESLGILLPIRCVENDCEDLGGLFFDSDNQIALCVISESGFDPSDIRIILQ